MLNLLRREIILEDSCVGNHYVLQEVKGPFVRVTASQGDHVDFGLRKWWKETEPAAIEEKERETSDIGTILHGYIAGVLYGQPLAFQHEWAKPVVEKFVAFVAKNNIVATGIEKRLVSNTLGLGGQVDFYGSWRKDTIVDATPCILDWKTGGVYPSYAVQLAIYQILVWEETGRLITELAVVQIPRDGEGEIEVHPIQDPLRALRAGLHTFERWKYDNYNKLKWACAPRELQEQRSKSRGKKRQAFDESWKPEYAWPWLEVDSVQWLDSKINNGGF